MTLASAELDCCHLTSTLEYLAERLVISLFQHYLGLGRRLPDRRSPAFLVKALDS